MSKTGFRPPRVFHAARKSFIYFFAFLVKNFFSNREKSFFSHFLFTYDVRSWQASGFRQTREGFMPSFFLCVNTFFVFPKKNFYLEAP